MKSKFKIYCALVACCLSGFWGCIDNQGTCTVVPATPAQSITYPYFGQGDTLVVEQFKGIAMRPGDTVVLKFPCQVGMPQTIPTGFGVTIQDVYAKLWRLGIVAPPPAGGNLATTATVSFSSPQYALEVFQAAADQVWPGDANADGRRNLLDLLPIAEGIKEFRRLAFQSPACSFQANAVLSYPPQPGGTDEMSTLYEVCPLQKSFDWAGTQIDYVHADCNLDGKIDETDADYLMSVLEPMYLPEFLKSPVQGTELSAGLSTVHGLVPSVQVEPAPDNRFTVTIPFDINIVSTNGVPLNNIVGLAFERPVAESAQYRLYRTALVFQQSAIFTATGVDPNTLWRQKFWGNLAINYLNGSCAGITDRVLDVGAFRLDTNSLGGNSTLCAGQCLVTLDDILRAILLDPAHVVTLAQHTVNGVVFVNQGGNINAESMNCTSDVTRVNFEHLCDNPEVFLRDGTNGDGKSLPSTAAAAFASPDIWVRHADGDLTVEKHQQPMDRNLEVVFVRVFNQSCDTVRNVKVQVNWALANTKATGQDFSNNLVGAAIMAMIPPFSNAIVRMDWKPEFGSGANLNGDPMLHIVAQVFAPGDASPGLPQGNILPTVLASNNMATRSTMMISNGTSGAAGSAFARIQLVPYTASSAVKLRVEEIPDSVRYPASHYGDLSIRFTGVSSSPVTNATGMQPVAGSTGQWEYALNPDAVAGTLALANTIPSNVGIEVRYQLRAGTVVPRLNARVPYRFRIYLITGGVEYSCSIVELEAQ